MLNLLKNLSWSWKGVGYYLIYLLVFIMFWHGLSLGRYKSLRIIQNDVVSYYAYLPAAFIYKDLSFEFIADLPSDFEASIWTETSPNGKQTLKTSMGVAVLNLPFFGLAHISANLFGIPANGYTSPYHLFILIAAISYLAAGIFYLRRILLLYFKEPIVIISLLVIVLGTNLFYYSTVEPGMSHTYSFFLFAGFLFYTIKFHGNPKWKYAALLGVFAALIFLVRASNIIVVLIFILYGLGYNYRNRINFLWKNRVKLIFLVLIAFALLFPQLMYWKFSTGSWFYYSYSGEGFYFNHPHIIDGLFSYRKGWLVYTPVMVFALIGFVFFRKKAPELFLPVLIFLILNLYIVFSWWCWWYGGSFGARALIETYVFLAIPLAALLEKLWTRKIWVKILSLVVLAFFVYLNLFQTRQYRSIQLHWDSISKELFWTSFLNNHWPDNYEELLDPPDYEKALRGGK